MKKQETSASKNEKSSSSKKKRLTIALSILGVLGVLIGMFCFFAFSRAGLFSVKKHYTISGQPLDINSISLEIEGKTYGYNKDVINILLLGVKMQEDDSNSMVGEQADMIMLLSINTRSGVTDLLPIPRDTTAELIRLDLYGRVYFTSEGALCNAHAYGERDRKIGGMLTEAAVSHLLYDVPIHRFASIDFAAVAPLTDCVGGVPVEAYPDYAHYMGLEFNEPIVLDGEQAAIYVRERSFPYMDGTNLSRMVRQRQFLASFVQVVKQRALKNPFSLFSLYDASKPYLSTDFSFREMVYIGFKALSISELNVHVMQGEMQGLEYVIDPEFLQQYIRDVMLVETSIG